MSRISQLLACLLCAAIAAPAFAALYKWTDAQGRTVYSDQPPSTDVKTEQLRAHPPPANPNAAKELAQRQADYQKRQKDSADAAAKGDKDRADAAKHTEICAQAKGQLRQLSENQILIYRYNEKGDREVMDQDAIGRERAKINTFLRENKCPA